MKLMFKAKLLLLAVVPLVLSILVTSIVTAYNEQTLIEENIATFREKLVGERKKQLKEVTQVAENVVKRINPGSNQVRLAEVKTALSDIKFGDSGYFFMYDKKGVNVFHPMNPSLEGKNLIDLTDPKGNKVIQGLIETAQRGDGYFNFMFEKPGTNELIDKIGYAVMVNNNQWMLGTGAYIDDIEHEVSKYRITAEAALEAQIWRLSLFGLGTVVITGLVVGWFAQRMGQPVNNMLEKLNDIASGDGDLTQRLSVNGHDEIALLGHAFNRFVEKLQGTIQHVAQVTARVTSTANDMANQTSSVAKKLQVHDNETEQVVTAVTEMSSAAQEVAQNTTQVADAATSATQDAQDAQAQVHDSIASVQRLVERMGQSSNEVDQLKSQSDKITSVLSVIGDIAEQTNLLALNAAIEAARAGEQGRGFAVVADEVRTLASRTQTSTHEIRDMLDGLHVHVDSAVKTIAESDQECKAMAESSAEIGEKITSVSAAFAQVNDMTSQIASAASEQTTVTEDIHRNLVSIRDIVASLLVSSEASSSAAADLSALGQELDALVGQFKI
ncbi:chemotaxis protein [Salinivibrio sp. IB574]|uniref:methyl-accepting chemotaxis protein n=1 Tax=Salinivibrio sp. IB574 TaxID=1909444 RepID=UPI000988A7AA|nr:methyl-accepting chemotaxis protein [Salinivibrio sp. IB574]OOF23049.1 chemotaxis protein [Salinivibrio sp. IB574]